MAFIIPEIDTAMDAFKHQLTKLKPALLHLGTLLLGSTLVMSTIIYVIVYC